MFTCQQLLYSHAMRARERTVVSKDQAKGAASTLNPLSMFWNI